MPGGAAPLLPASSSVDPADALMNPELEVVPVLDDHGLLRLGDRWVAISDAQLPVVRLLLDRFGRVVSTAAIVDACVASGHSGSEASVRSLLSRLKRRVADLGLRIHTVRGRGFMLTAQGQRG